MKKELLLHRERKLEVLRACLAKEVPRPAMIVMTGVATVAEIEEANGLGASGILLKPFTRQQLLAALSPVEQGLATAA